MKKILFLLLTFSLTGFSSLLLAQTESGERQRGDRGNMVEQRVERMAEALDLTDEQKAAITRILTRQQERVRSAETPEERRELMRATNERVQRAIGEILTPEQREQWQKHLGARREEARRGGRGERTERGERAVREERAERGQRGERGEGRERGERGPNRRDN